MQIAFEDLPEDLQRKLLQAVASSQEITITRRGSGGKRNLAVVTPWPQRNRGHGVQIGHGNTQINSF